MSDGIRVWDADGALRLDSDRYTARLLLTRHLPANSPGSMSVPGVTPQNTIAYTVPAATSQLGASRAMSDLEQPYRVIVGNGVISWSYVWAGYPLSDSGRAFLLNAAACVLVVVRIL